MPPTQDEVMKALEVVMDPELNLSVVDLGLVYKVDVIGNKVIVDMTLTTPACPVGPLIVAQAQEVVRRLPDVEDAHVNLVWEPEWTPERMSTRLKKAREMGLFP